MRLPEAELLQSTLSRPLLSIGDAPWSRIGMPNIMPTSLTLTVRVSLKDMGCVPKLPLTQVKQLSSQASLR